MLKKFVKRILKTLSSDTVRGTIASLALMVVEVAVVVLVALIS